MSRVLCVIPARGGSKGLPGKNLRELAGLPLIAHTIKCAALIENVARVVVSTDSDEIADVARSFGADVPFRRPAPLASDTAPMWPVVQHALEQVAGHSTTMFDGVLLLDPTSPGRLPSDVEGAFAALASDPDADGIVGVSEPSFSPYWHMVVRDGPYMRDLIPGAAEFVRRQDLPVTYRINAMLYVWRPEFVRRAEQWRSGRTIPYVLDDERAIHIDTADQFELATLLLDRGLIKFPWLDESA